MSWNGRGFPGGHRDAFDVPPYVNSADQSGAVPFLDIANRYVLAGAQYDPQVLAGQIASQLSNPSSPVAQLVSAALQHLSPAHQTVLVETFYRGGTMATVARELGIPHGTARSRLHYALDAMRKELQEHDAIAAS